MIYQTTPGVSIQGVVEVYLSSKCLAAEVRGVADGGVESEEHHLHGQRRWNQRLWRRLARAPKGVAGRAVARPLALGALSRLEPPGAPQGEALRWGTA